MLPQRPSAKDLLQHRFIRAARRTSLLTELIERYQDYRARSPRTKDQNAKGGVATIRHAQGFAAIPATIDGAGVGATIRSEWDFATVRSSVRDSRFVFDAEDEEDPYGYGYEGEVEDGATAESTHPNGNGIGALKAAAHSTVMIKVKDKSPPSSQC